MRTCLVFMCVFIIHSFSIFCYAENSQTESKEEIILRLKNIFSKPPPWVDAVWKKPLNGENVNLDNTCRQLAYFINLKNGFDTVTTSTITWKDVGKSEIATLSRLGQNGPLLASTLLRVFDVDIQSRTTTKPCINSGSGDTLISDWKQGEVIMEWVIFVLTSAPSSPQAIGKTPEELRDILKGDFQKRLIESQNNAKKFRDVFKIAESCCGFTVEDIALLNDISSWNTLLTADSD